MHRPSNSLVDFVGTSQLLHVKPSAIMQIYNSYKNIIVRIDELASLHEDVSITPRLKLLGGLSLCLYTGNKFDVVFAIYGRMSESFVQSLANLFLPSLPSETGAITLTVEESIQHKVHRELTMSVKTWLEYGDFGLNQKVVRSYVTRESGMLYRLLMPNATNWRENFYELKMLNYMLKQFQHDRLEQGLVTLLRNSIEIANQMQKVSPLTEERLVEEATQHYQQLAERADAILTDCKSMDWPEIFEKYERT